MASCAEAAHCFSKCQITKLDRNMNGVPCENLCGQTPEAMCDRIRRAPMFMSEGRLSIGSPAKRVRTAAMKVPDTEMAGQPELQIPARF